MKRKIVLTGLILSLATVFTAFSADKVLQFRKQGTASVELEYAQQTEKIILQTNDNIIESVEMVATGESRSQSSIRSNSKSASDVDLKKFKQRLRFNPPQE
jgi:rare lipoprotein A (peptidoglycan hydrolase)